MAARLDVQRGDLERLPGGVTAASATARDAVPAPTASVSVAPPARHNYLSTLQAGRNERRLALAVVIFSAICFVAAVPFARTPLPKVPAFISTYESALAINDLLTAVLLFGQFRGRRSWALLVLSCGYLFDALIIVPHALTFPGVFAPTGLLGAGSQSTAWLYVFWHGGFPLFIIAFVALTEREATTKSRIVHARIAAACGVAAVIAVVFGLTVLATVGHDRLPELIANGDFTQLITKGVSPTIWVLSLIALIVLWRKRTSTVLELWLMVVMSAWLFDIALSAVIGSSRFDLGWYGGRIYGLLASSFVLAVLLTEASGLQGRLAEAKAQIEDHARRLEERVRERTAELERSTRALEAEIAEREQTEERLRQSQKMEAIGNLTGGMAHDFNNVLAVVIGSLELLQERKIDEESNKLVNTAIGAALRGADLTRSLLAFARRQPLKPQRIEIKDLIGNTTKLLKRTLGENIEITVDLSSNTWPVVIDPAQLESSLVNLANNARDAMPGGGSLHIATANRRLDEDYASQHPEVTAGDYVMIEVGDSGSGIPRDMLGRIFEPFFTTKEQGKGTGLGLSMVFGFMKQSGGHINVYSEEGVGTTFRLYLPRSAGASAQEEARTGDTPAQGKGETILVVEDNADLRRLAARQLAELGYRVLDVGEAASAITVLEQEDVNLLLTDLILPGGRSGTDLIRIALERRPQLKVVMMSGFPGAILPGGTPELPQQRLLSKPVRKAELARTIRAVLDD
jgi:signal transduction histidine kinase/CheY-like chemotaxis protein